MTNYIDQYNAFVETLEDIFMMDHEELDFGIYRIMNYKRDEIKDFLKNRLLNQVDDILAKNVGGDQLALETELETQLGTLERMGFSRKEAEASGPIMKLREKMKRFRPLAELKNDVYSGLVTFFSRYYKSGDFISQRRYKSDDTYAIPYNGEEVKLYWANEDQYYIKSSEHFKRYSFVAGKKTVHFVLSDADMQMNNDKNENKKVRRFVLNETKPLEVVNEELCINFDYKLMPARTLQKTLNETIFKQIRDAIIRDYKDFIAAIDVDPHDNGLDSILQKRINHYTAKNSFDYFIHKDLGKFLSRELDFFIKNEILNIDNMDAESIQAHVATAKTIKEIGEKVISMLAQLEDYQRKLWLKKKFVVQTDYCITLDRIPKELYPRIAENNEQREEWVNLFGIDKITAEEAPTQDGTLFEGQEVDTGELREGYSEPLNVRFLEQNPTLVLDTAFFDDDFKHTLLAAIENVDEQCQGLLVNSENFQALRLLNRRYAGDVKCVYVDPPYNTGDDDFAYKDNYQESSWLTCIDNRLELTKPYYQDGGSFAASIDINEVDQLTQLLDKNIGKEQRKANITVRRASITGAKVINPGPVNISENVIMYANGVNKWKPENAYRERVGGYDDRYGNIILNPDDNYENWQFGTVLDEFAKEKGVAKSKLSKIFGDSYDEELLKFAIKNSERVIRLAALDDASISDAALELKKLSKQEPSKIFHMSREGANDYYVKDGNAILFYKDRLRWMGDGVVPVEKVSDIWDDVLPNDLHNEGGVALKKGKKPEKLINRIFESTTVEGDLIMDYFAGSATSGAVALKSGRRFINVEANDYFDEIPLRRLKNTLNGDKSGVTTLYQWKGGGMIKYLRLEQYEDTLNNLQVKAPVEDLLSATSEEFRDSYMLHYMVESEVKSCVTTEGDDAPMPFESETFRHPFSVQMMTTRLNEQKPTRVDMVETFNYLIGLHVEKMRWPMEGLCIVNGRQHISDKRIIVIWRDVDKVDNEALKNYFAENIKPELGNKAYTIYVNGENTLQNLAGASDRWIVLPTEKAFINKMYEE